VYFSDGFVPIDELRHAISSADVGVVAMRRDAFRDVTLAGKMFDFIAMGKPVLSSRTRSVEQTFPPTVSSGSSRTTQPTSHRPCVGCTTTRTTGRDSPPGRPPPPIRIAGRTSGTAT
jgi:hypothetical protein